jgi:hypothetical protein
MAFQPIRSLLPQAIRQAGIDEQVSSVRILTLAKETLQKFWGEEKAAYVEWVSFKDGVLRVRCQAPAAKQELKVWEVRLLNELNHALGGRRVLKLMEAM